MSVQSGLGSGAVPALRRGAAAAGARPAGPRRASRAAARGGPRLRRGQRHAGAPGALSRTRRSAASTARRPCWPRRGRRGSRRKRRTSPAGRRPSRSTCCSPTRRCTGFTTTRRCFRACCDRSRRAAACSRCRCRRCTRRRCARRRTRRRRKGPGRIASGAVRSAPPVPDAAWYYDLLAPRTAALDIWRTEYLHVLRGEDPVARWAMGSSLRPYLDALEGEPGCAMNSWPPTRPRRAAPTRRKPTARCCSPSGGCSSSRGCSAGRPPQQHSRAGAPTRDDHDRVLAETAARARPRGAGRRRPAGAAPPSPARAPALRPAGRRRAASRSRAIMRAFQPAACAGSTGSRP